MTDKEVVVVRRSAKMLPFILTGGAFGTILALALFFLTGQASAKDWPSVLGFLLVFLSAIGSFGGLYLAVMFDRWNSAKAKLTEATKLKG
ncbi:MAG: hypothetical protein ACKOWK_04875 [Micrococcales bacterium]